MCTILFNVEYEELHVVDYQVDFLFNTIWYFKKYTMQSEKLTMMVLCVTVTLQIR